MMRSTLKDYSSEADERRVCYVPIVDRRRVDDVVHTEFMAFAMESLAAYKQFIIR